MNFPNLLLSSMRSKVRLNAVLKDLTLFSRDPIFAQSTTSVRISWARLLKRVFDIDIEHCQHCGGDMKIIAAILESGAITKMRQNL